MYYSFNEVWHGFSKNLFGLVRYRLIPFSILTLALFTMSILPYITLWFTPLTKLASVAITMNIAMRIALVLKYKHPFFTSVILHPFGVLLTLLISINSVYQLKKGRVQWKGREINLKMND